MRVLRMPYNGLPDDLWDADFGNRRNPNTQTYACHIQTKAITHENDAPQAYTEDEEPDEWFDILAKDELHAFQILMAYERDEWEWV